jgi:SulP family sulfate permease
MSLATAMTGLLLCVLGFTNAARAIRFLPYPVIGGFLGATGWLMVTGAMQVVSDRKPALFNLGAFADAGVLEKLAAGAVVAIALHVLLRRSKSPFVLPGVLLAAFLVAHIVVFASGWTLAAAQTSGWMFNPQPGAKLTLPWNLTAIHTFPWAALPSIAGDVLAVMFVTISTLLLNTTGIEIATRVEANIERDLKVLGIANMVTAM